MSDSSASTHNDEESIGAGEDLDRTVVSTPASDGETQTEAEATENLDSIGAAALEHAAADEDASALAAREANLNDIVDDLRQRMGRMAAEMVSYKRANETYKRANETYRRELGSIQLAAEIASRKSSSRASGATTYSDFHGFSDQHSTRSEYAPSDRQAASKQMLSAPTQAAPVSSSAQPVPTVAQPAQSSCVAHLAHRSSGGQPAQPVPVFSGALQFPDSSGAQPPPGPSSQGQISGPTDGARPALMQMQGAHGVHQYADVAPAPTMCTQSSTPIQHPVSTLYSTIAPPLIQSSRPIMSTIMTTSGPMPLAPYDLVPGAPPYNAPVYQPCLPNAPLAPYAPMSAAQSGLPPASMYAQIASRAAVSAAARHGASPIPVCFAPPISSAVYPPSMSRSLGGLHPSGIAPPISTSASLYFPQYAPASSTGVLQHHRLQMPATHPGVRPPLPQQQFSNFTVAQSVSQHRPQQNYFASAMPPPNAHSYAHNWPAAEGAMPFQPPQSQFGYPHAGLPPVRPEPVACAQAVGRANRRTHELPAFGGKAEEWPFFICAYVETTHEFGYSNLENMLRLQKCLVGEAKRRVASILIRPEHVDRAIESLAKAYGTPEALLESQFSMVRKLPRVDGESRQQMTDFSIAVDGLISFFDVDGLRHHYDNSHLLNELEGKLSISDRKDWSRSARHIQPQPSILHFAAWLDDAAGVMSRIRNFTGHSDASSRPRPARATGNKQSSQGSDFVFLNAAAETSRRSSDKCSFCSEAHDIRRCSAFLALSVRARLNEIKKNPICYGCLQPNHLLPACKDRKRCGIDSCEMWHDPLLHPGVTTTSKTAKKAPKGRNADRSRTPQRGAAAASTTNKPQPAGQANMTNPATATAASTSSTPTQDGASNMVNHCRTGASNRLLLFRVVPVVLYGPKRTEKTFALLDEGSSVSIMDKALADDLGLCGEDADLDLGFANGHGTIQTTRVVQFGISGVQPNAERFEVGRVYATSSLTLPTQTVDRATILASNGHLDDVPFAEFETARPRLLIGLDHHHLGLPQQIRTSALGNGIVAAMTKLGWVLFGSDGRGSLPGAVVLHVRHQDEAMQSDEAERWAQLNDIVRQFIATEDFGAKTPTVAIESDADKRAHQILKATTKRIGDRFETGLLWAKDDVDLPDSRAMATQRLVGIESRMRRDADFAQQYRAQIQAYIDKGYVRKATAEEAAQSGGRSWFLPHFAVRNINKPGKFRLVFDAAAKVANVSLNSVLLAGPDANVPLTRLLFRFRLGVVAVCADVREMYHQVRVRKEDQMAQRFLWRNGDSNAEPEVYVMNVMTFGSTCSPASAQYVKNVNAQEFEVDYPEAAVAIQSGHYVDDYVVSFQSSDDANRITSDVINVQQRGGFELRGVISNCEAVRRRFGEETGGQTVELEPKGLVQKILGMTWRTEDDAFCFQTRFGRVRAGIMDGTRKPTKRDVLSVTMSIFDPFGLLADFVLASKMIMKELWRKNVDWDEQIDDSTNTQWQAWRALIERTRLVRIPRCYSPSIHTPGLQLHIFADASEDAFSAVAYWRVIGAAGVEIVFIAGKVKCAPMRVLSIPRMELQAAVLGKLLMVEILDCHSDLNIEKTVLWSDSQTILKWLRCTKRRYKMWVGVRVAEIVESAPADLWRWVPTAQNPADDATRVKLPLKFEPDSRWLRGPAWLAEDEENWPTDPSFEDPDEIVDEEVLSGFVGAIARRGVVEYDRFNNFFRLVRTLAWVRRFIGNSRERKEQRVAGELRAAEFHRASDLACRLVQQEAYGKELAILRKGEPLSSDSSVFSLKPYIGEDDLLRVHGRVDAADERFITSQAKRPILLPRTHRFSMLLVQSHHEQFAHQLANATIAAVRIRYWVPQLRRLVNQVQQNCQECKLRRAKPTPPSQGQLPRDRMDVYVRPFTNTGMDFFGPVFVTVGRRREKRWVALFTCLTTRAVHLEIAADLSTDASLMCIRNLSNIRGVPSLIRCDNGTNFVGARNEMERETEFFDSEVMQRELSVKGIEWRFNCPANPEAGGAWERLVQSIKRVLRITLKEEAPRVETLRSLLIEAANIVNARPLTHLQVTPDDPEPLTPNHFLMGGANVAAVPNPEIAEPNATRKQWEMSRSLSNRFWAQFVRDYLPELTRRGRHYPELPPLRVGDLVVICDEKQSLGRWKRGRIIEVSTAADGAVRKAVVRTSDGTLRRPATKLARIDVGASNSIDVRGVECR